MSEEILKTEEQQEKELGEQMVIRRNKLAALQAEGRNPYEKVRYPRTHTSRQVTENFDELEGKEVAIAGRMTIRRIMGKASFAKFMDGEGIIQAYIRRDDVGEDDYARFKQCDIGDIFGVSGKVFKTQTGEVTIHADKIELLSKSLLPLPE